MQIVKRYSQAFKLQVVTAVESGKFHSLESARHYYDITGHHTIKRWLNQYGKNHLIPKIVRIETMNEKDRIKELKMRIKLLEKALTETRLDQIIAESQFEVVCDQFGVKDYDAMKKKIAMKQSTKQ